MRWQEVYAKFGNARQSGFGLHDSPNKYLNPPNVTNHARALKRYGIDNYKILADADNKKAGRVQIYRQHGIHSIVRTHVDRPTPSYVIDLQVARDYVNAGAWAIEPMNEPNLRDEWQDSTFPASWSEYGKVVARQWIRNADVILAAGGIPVTPALSPGGHVPHREATLRFLDGINFHGGRGQLDRAVIGVHWRPLNNPIDTIPGMGSPPNTTLWRENEWFFATYSQYLGYMPGFVETESGYSPGSSENGTFPPMTQATWASFNQELYSRLDPAHAKATPGQVICQDYWIEGTDGSGVWRIDAAFINWLEENQPPDEPLWGKAIRAMGINWDRKVLVSGGTTPPPPDPAPVPVPPAPDLPPRVTVDLPDFVSITEANALPGEKFWRAVRVERRRGDANGGQRHIYHWQPHSLAVTMVVGIEATPVVLRIPHDKPFDEPAANHPMDGGGNRYWSRVEGLGVSKSDQINGMTMFENQHESFHLTWELVTMPTPETPQPGDWRRALMDRLDAAQLEKGIQLNPQAAIQAKMFEHGFVPVVGETGFTHPEKSYPATQKGERLNDGAERYYTWSPSEGVRWFEQNPISLGVALPVPYVSQRGTGANESANDCGAAAVKSLALLVSPSAPTVNAMAREAAAIEGEPYPAYDGLTMRTLIELGRRHGVKLAREKPATWEDALWEVIDNLGSYRPMIALVSYDGLPVRNRLIKQSGQVKGHYIVLVGKSGDTLFYHDPYHDDTKGKALEMTWKELRTAWELNPKDGNPKYDMLVMENDLDMVQEKAA